jgi:prepilin-type N-terminal cleavage/methylation domain-containing protein
MKKAFTIVELLVAMAIIVVMLAGSGYVFSTAVQAERTARATAEIARKIRGITDQLNADFKGIRKEIKPKEWRNIQKAAYVIYVSLFTHLIYVSDWENRVVYVVIAVLYLNNKIIKELKK